MADYLEHERLFQALMSELVGQWSKDHIDEVRHYFDHGEYGLAFERFLEVQSEAVLPISENCAQLAEQLAALMDMLGDSRLAEFRAYKAAQVR
jgi:hypothetical protein